MFVTITVATIMVMTIGIDVVTAVTMTVVMIFGGLYTAGMAIPAAMPVVNNYDHVCGYCFGHGQAIYPMTVKI